MIPDGRGLYLIVQPTGAKSWAMFFRGPSRRMVKLTLGPYSPLENGSDKPIVMGAPLTLAAARRLAAEVNLRRASGEDVAAERLRQKAERQASEANTFPAAARDFITNHSMNRVRGWREQARLLGLNSSLEEIPGGLCQLWRDRPISAIDGNDIHRVVDDTRRHGAPGLERRSDGLTESRARSMFRTLSKFFGWLVQQRRLTVNPCAGVHRPETPRARERVLSDAELVKFWQSTEELGPPFGQVLRLLLLTGQRLNEIAGLQWEEVSDTALHLLGSRTKNHRDHTVPLSLPAREVLASVQRVPGSPLVFTTTGSTPISGWSRTKQRLDALMGDVPPWRIHDLRRTAITGMARSGADLPAIERAVNHISGGFGGVTGIYQRHKYADEVRAALDEWAALLLSIVS
jgi:integrase